MEYIENLISKYPGRTFVVLLLSAIPPFFINLGLLPLFADEPTRANVALEMILSHNYSVPTIGGEYYYNKPPLYNWLLAVVFIITGNFSEFSVRLPAIVPLFIFAITIYYSTVLFLKDKRIALLSAVLMLVNGRMLVYDSMLGHIDIFYSWLTFSSFMFIYYFYQKKKWFLLFFVSYIITAATFLCKGMPSILFQGLTIIALLIYTKNIKRFFSWQHIVSGIFCLLIIGIYFYNYSLYNPNLEGYLQTIWNQSSQRTAASVGLWRSIHYIALFPFEYAGHLFPASLLLLFCFNRFFIRGIKAHAFLTFCAVTFCANIWIYWLSPETRPRYLLMLFPLLFILWSHAYYSYRDRLPKLNRLFEVILTGLACVVTVAIPVAYFGKIAGIDLLPLKAVLVFILAAICTGLVYRAKDHKIIFFLLLLLVLRLGFSWFVIPQRLKHDEGNYFRKVSMEMGKISAENPVYFYQYHPDIPSIPFHDKLIFYIQRTKLKQVKFSEVDTLSGYYITFDRDLKNPDAKLLKTYKSNLKFYQVK